MTSSEAYKEFLLKLNKNDSNTNINVSKGEFVLRYNEIRLFWLAEKLKSKEDSDEIHDLSELLEEDKPLSFIKKGPRAYQFKLPTEFFNYVSSYSLATRKKCSERTLYNWLVKPRNVNTLLKDENNNPSFDYEETIAIISEDKLKVYYNDFKIDKVFLTYYREPGKIDIEGYIKLDGTYSANINPDISDSLVYEILNRIVLEVARSYENPEGYSLAADRLKQEF